MTEIELSAKAGKSQLAKLEKRMEANTKAAWKENGLIMLHIRNAGLYKAQYGTFDEYLTKRWEFSQVHGNRLMASAEFMQKITHCIENDSVKSKPIGLDSAIKLPANEAQIRPLLTCLEHDGERLHVWNEVANSGEKKITADLVQRHVDEFKASGQVVQDVEIKLPEVVVPQAMANVPWRDVCMMSCSFTTPPAYQPAKGPEPI